MKAYRANVLFLIIILSFTLLQNSTNAIELDKTQEARAQKIFYLHLSPFCPGRLISDCPSTSATELKEKIREKISLGESDDQIEEYLTTMYGDRIRAEPAFRGIGLLAWLGIVVFVISGLLIYLLWLRKSRVNNGVAEEQTGSDIDQNMLKRIEAEIKENA